MSELVKHAEEELKRAGLFDADSDYAGAVGQQVLQLIKTFAGNGNSGGSAEMVIHVFSRLSQFEPITPLTGEDDEWFDRTEEYGTKMLQNKRCSHVFKDDRGAYDINVVGNRQDMAITFPYVP